ncbi:MAG: hypothetical protein ABI664_07975 [bacterium]
MSSCRGRNVLIDDYLPRYDVVERHSIRVRATQPQTYAAIAATDFAGGAIIRVLLVVRMLPSALLHGLRGFRTLTERRATPMTLASMERGGFHVLSERAPTELVIGLEGRFWTLSGDRCTPSAEVFRTRPPQPGTARAVWDFRVRPIEGHGCELSTETRVLCADAATRRRFIPYWTVIRPFSGLIRHAMLRAIRRTAESR